ncbi:MAG: DUF3563 family protein [Burkholderiales bacterium]|nr:DUF3563 family protein [Burkholderiales bacterium]
MKLDRTFPDNSLMSTMLSLVQATFFDALPANAERRPPIAPADLEPAKRVGWVERSLAAVDDWFSRQHQKDLEAFLAGATDLADLERRQRQFDGRRYGGPYYWCARQGARTWR